MTASRWFQDLNSNGRKDLLVLMHEIRREPLLEEQDELTMTANLARERFTVLLRHLEEDHEEAKQLERGHTPLLGGAEASTDVDAYDMLMGEEAAAPQLAPLPDIPAINLRSCTCHWCREGGGTGYFCRLSAAQQVKRDVLKRKAYKEDGSWRNWKVVKE